MIDWFCWLGILPIKLLFPFNCEGALICPVAFVLAVEETERNFLPSTTAIPSAFVLSVFAMVTIIAVGSFFVSVPFSLALVTVSVLSGSLFGYVVHCSFLPRLIGVPWFRMGPLAASRFLLLVLFLEPSPLRPVGYAIFLHYLEQLRDCLWLTPGYVFPAWSQIDPLHHRIDDALVGNIWCSCAKLHDTLKIFLQGHASLP